MNNLQKIFNDENKTRILGLLSILTLLWVILYFIPEIVVSLFNTLLGNLILMLTILFIYMNNRMYGLLTGLIVILLYRFYRLSKEGFTQDSEQSFLLIQNTINKNTIFDMNVIGILTYQSDEGQFLLNGILVENSNGNKKEELPSGFGSFPYKSGLKTSQEKSIIKCNMQNENNPTLEKITYTGKGAIFNEQTQFFEPVDYNNLENIIPGFTFLNSPCNPCGSIATIPDYSCKYNLHLKTK